MSESIEQAKLKVCPYIQKWARPSGNQIFGIVDQFTHANVNCLTTGCMGWRVSKEGYGYCFVLSGHS
jgi:hypothetical protein